MIKVFKVFFKQVSFGILISSLLFTGCGVGGNSPSSVVKKAINARINQDVESFTECFYNIREAGYDSDPRLLFEYQSSIQKFEILNERIFDNGEKAGVMVKYTVNDFVAWEEEVLLVKTKNGWKISANAISHNPAIFVL